MRYAALSILIVALLVPCSEVGSAPDGDADVTLELTYPAGKSPKVFTEGWVFGATCKVTKDGKTEDRSSKVAWSGTGTFTPAVGAESRPAFKAPGANRITLTVNVGGKDVAKSWNVVAVSSKAMDDEGTTFAKLGDLAHCPNCAHGCNACPHDVKGPIISGSPTVTIDGLPAARKGDKGIHSACCGSNTFEITGGDPTVLIDGKPAARVGDETAHCGGNLGKIMGPAERYYAAFAAAKMNLEKKDLERKEDESDEEWNKRLDAWLKTLTVDDFTFDPTLDDPQSMILVIQDAALKEYPFLEKGRYALKIKGKMDGKGFSGTILLTLRGTFPSAEALKKELSVDDAALKRAVVIGRADGTGKLTEGGQTYDIGPVTKGWTPAAKKDAVELWKTFRRLFDCFIANAVYENPVSPEVDRFREFRDRVLRRSEAGRRLVRLYYEHGPGYARALRKNDALRPLVRVGLDRVGAWIESLDLDDPATQRRVDALVRCADALASAFWDAPASDPLRRLLRLR